MESLEVTALYSDHLKKRDELAAFFGDTNC